MSPRSAEFLEVARRRLTAARQTLAVDPGGAISLAYYAMLNAARAALSERELYARTHGGTWHLFRQTFVTGGDFDGGLAAAAQKAQPDRERADYEGWLPSEAEASAIVALAERFLDAVEVLTA